MDGEPRARALEIVGQLARRLRPWIAEPTRASHELIGVALLLAAQRGLDAVEDDFGELLQRAIASAGATPQPAALWGGSLGFAWAMDQTLGLLEADAGDVLVDYDASLAQQLDRGTAPEHFDLVRGLAGWAVYLASRPGEGAKRSLERVLSLLAARVTTGGAWETPGAAADRIDVGVAHGVAGVVGALSVVLLAGAGAARERVLLEGAVRWVLDQRARVPGAACEYPAFVTGETGEPARLAWCYGDAGIAAALLLAARALRSPEVEASARETARHAAGLSLRASHVVDAGICHGAAGLGLIFARLFNATGDEVLRDAAARWFGDACARFSPEAPLGYRALQPGEDGRLVPADDGSVLMGASGIGLAFLAACGGDAPRWDAALVVGAQVDG